MKRKATSGAKKARIAGGTGAKAGHGHSHAHTHDDGHTHSHAHAHEGHTHSHSHTHDDGHTHSHAHTHDDGHTHSHADTHDEGHHHAGRSTDRRADLPRHAGKGKVLFFDAPSGLAGDMIIASLVDLGVPERVVEDAVAALSLGDVHVHFGTRERSGIVATSFDVHAGPAPQRTYGAIRKLLDRSKLAAPIRARAHATFRRLAESEARVHAMAVDDVHFHEVGAVDAIVDIVGSAAALDYLGATLLVSPLPMGHGWVKAQHGRIPLPAPAVVDCLRGLSTYDGGLAFEFVTPTGAAIVGAHAEASTRWPAMVPSRSGWGAGTASLADRPNVLRAVLGDLDLDVGRSPSHASHVVLEANLDDATGELLGHAIEALLAAGANDAWAVPLTMKKGRPAFQLAALATRGTADLVAATMLRETTTIGVRRHEVARVERPRRMELVDTPFGQLPVKVAGGPFGPPSRKPEFDACRAVALAHGVPVRVVLQAAVAALAPVSLQNPTSGDELGSSHVADKPPRRTRAKASPKKRRASKR